MLIRPAAACPEQLKRGIWSGRGERRSDEGGDDRRQAMPVTATHGRCATDPDNRSTTSDLPGPNVTRTASAAAPPTRKGWQPLFMTIMYSE